MANNYEFAGILDEFLEKEVQAQEKRNKEAFAILTDIHRKWDSTEQREAAEAKYKAMEKRLQLLTRVYDAGRKMAKDHENLTDKTASWYAKWYNTVSNEGRQETELMEAQANVLNEIFLEMYREIADLELNLKPPAALNLK